MAMEIVFLTGRPLPTWLAVPAGPVRAVHLYLHGSGERGGDPARLSRWSLPGLIARGLDVPFMVVAPLCPADGDWADAAHVRAAEDCLLAALPAGVSPCLSISGFSMGARGVWQALETRRLPYARALIVAGRVPAGPCPTLGSDTAIRLIHGALDDHQDAVAMADYCARMRQRNRTIVYEEIPGAGHFIADAVYGRAAVRDWLGGGTAMTG
jgi:hypothetical protein